MFTLGQYNRSEMADTLLITKFYIPRKRENSVSRPRLTRKILAGVNQPGGLMLLCGPAGFGKTTLLAELIPQINGSVAWLSLDEGDNDPSRFWTYLIKACQKIKQGAGETALAMFNIPQNLSIEAVPLMLVNDLAGSDAALVLVLDDLHLIQNQEIHQALVWFVEHLPGNFHLIVSTRIDPPWPLARLRARNQLVEIRVNELRFTVEESKAFLLQIMGINLTEADMEALDARTEGWAAGLQLAALSMQGRSDVSAFINSFSGSHLFIAEYLAEEVFKNQPNDVQVFLLKTSILERMNAGLCEAVTGCPDGQSQLTALLRANLFVLPLDDDGNWFRYHHLFADLLRNRLKQKLSPVEINGLHQKAATWFEQAGMDAEAIEHAMTAGDYQHVIRMLERIALPMILQAHVRTVEAWLAGIPAELLERSPRINLACAWMYLLRGLTNLAEPYLERLRITMSENDLTEEDPEAQGEWLALQAKLLNLQGKAGESIVLANQARHMLPIDNIYMRTLMQLEQATAYQQLSEFEQAALTFQKIAMDARKRGDFDSELLGISGRARMTLQQGKLNLTKQIAEEGLRRMEVSGRLTPFSATLFGEIGQIYYHWHQLDKADEFLKRSVQVSGRSGYIDPEMYYHIIRSKVYQMEGDWPKAEAEMQTVSELSRISPPAMIRESVSAQRVRVELAFDRVENAQAILKAEGFDIDGTAQLPELSAETSFTHPVGLLYNSALRYRFHLVQTKRSNLDLQKLVKYARDIYEGQLKWQQIPNALETLLLRFEMFAALGDEPHSLANLTRAVKLAERESFISVFVEEGQQVAQALVALLKQNLLDTAHPAFVHQILAAFPKSQSLENGSRPEDSKDKSSQVEILPMIEALTRRELEVLQMIAAGDSNQVIAEKLVITISAVKKHTTNIYGKLNVNSRTQAVARARKLGLVSSG